MCATASATNGQSSTARRNRSTADEGAGGRNEAGCSPVVRLSAITAAPSQEFAMTESPNTAARLSGMQPTDTLHLGNYLGALKNWVRMQDEMPCLFCVVDMHAITVWQDPAELSASTREVAAAYIAAGIDPERSVLFNQSQVPEHAELAWIFNCVARLGWLDRMTQFKEKAGKHRKRLGRSLHLSGADGRGHPRLQGDPCAGGRGPEAASGTGARHRAEIQQRFFGAGFFPAARAGDHGTGTRVMSLRDGTKKMSKSDESDNSRINLTDDADAIAQKIRKAKTDPNPLPENPKELESRPEAENLINIYAGLCDQSPEVVLGEYSGAQFSTFKNALADIAVAKLTPIAAAMRDYLSDRAELDRVLVSGAARARAIAEPGNARGPRTRWIRGE